MDYRLFYLGPTERIKDVGQINSETDAEACESAALLAGDRPFELWRGERMVIRRLLPNQNKGD